MRNKEVFYEIPCLTERSTSLNGLALQKKWFKKADKRIIGQFLQKFIEYNQNEFNFLGVTPFLLGTDQNTSIAFRSSSFIGTIPLRASDTGKQIGDFVVTPKFSGKNRFEDYIEILDLLGSDISPESADSLPLISGRNFRPPLYLEAIKFISAFESLSKRKWHKFNSIEKVTDQPIGRVNWSKYTRDIYKVENQVKFPVRKNILTENHKEYSELRFVFDICNQELTSSKVPFRIKSRMKPRLNFLENKLYNLKPKQTTTIKMSFNDPTYVKKCKIIGNRILNSNLSESTAWRVDFADVFEKFVQFIFKKIARSKGGKLLTNHRFTSKTSKYYFWELKHLEPDAIFIKDNLNIFIDAKYKSHLYNKFGQSEQLKEDYRQDLHQILAYASFSKTADKFAFLCYPSSDIEIKRTEYRNRINQAKNIVFTIGIPFSIRAINETTKKITDELNHIEKQRTTNIV